MAPDRRRRAAAALLLGALLRAALGAAGATAAEPWWVPLGLGGRTVDLVAAADGELAVRAGGELLLSRDGGAHLRADPAAAALLAGRACTRDGCRAPRAGGGAWGIDHGTVVALPASGTPQPLAGVPPLGPDARLVAAPARPAGTLVAVAGDGTVWRRDGAGRWGRSLVLLPDGPAGRVPRVTSIAAFDRPLTPTVYLATDGYSVLISQDGGDDWQRAGPGLPDGVLSLTADSGGRAVFAGTRDGLWVHHLQPPPRPPDYAAGGLWWRWLLVLAICAAAAALAVGVMRRAMATPTG